MAEFRVEIAGRVVNVKSLFDSTEAFCAEYLTLAEPDFSVEITPEDIAHEGMMTAREAQVEGLPPRTYPEAALETTAVLRKIARRLLDYDTLLLHGSVVAVDGAAYLFTAKSGTGKSTHTRLWREMLGDRAVMVNDDKPFLRITEEEIDACGSPWNGKHRLGSNIRVPLKAVCILERGAENVIRQIPANEALPMLLQQSSRPGDGSKMGKYLTMIDRLTRKAAFYRLQCNMEPQAAQVAYGAMSQMGK